MEKYIYVRILSGNYIWASDPSVLNWIFTEVKKHIPSCATRNELHDVIGERVSFQLHQLNSKDTEVYMWLLKLLCENGYEPFEVIDAGTFISVPNILHFRKKIQ
jgi:hypothetical protein